MSKEVALETVFRRVAAAKPRNAIGASYAVADANPVVLTSGPTVAGGSVKVASDACWHIGSISKSFTATLVMRLVDQGALMLDTPIETYLPVYRDVMHADWKSLKLRHLLSHTAGLPATIPRAILRETYAYEPYNGRRVALSAMWIEPLKKKIGTYTYSNIGYVLAGLIAEEVKGASWEQLILSEIAEPLGLTSLGFGAPNDVNAPRGHRSFLGFKRPIAPEDLSSDNPRWLGPAGTIHLSLADLTKWGQVHIRACKDRLEDFLSPESSKTMQSPGLGNYGFGWVITTLEGGGSVVWHDGSNTMWYAILALDLDNDTVISVATNVFAPKRAERLLRELHTVLLGK